MGLQGQGWLMDIIRSIFGFLDSIVYGLIKWILFGIFDLANLTTNSSVFSGIYSRIYIILGIFMAFKLSFSFFQYIIDPESMTGKGDKAISKLFMRVFVMLIALIFLPVVLFGDENQEGILSRAQRAFLPTLPKLIFGVNDIGGLATGGSNFSASIEQSANDISVATLSGFFAPPKELDSVCGSGTYDNTPPIKTMDDFMNNLNIACNKQGTGFVGLFATKYYKYSYMLFISTIVGVLVAALLLGITLDIAKRIFKMMILEVIAPIPIMSLIDPKGSKDGAFSKWVHSLITTFVDIFIKLGLVYIIIVLIHMIVNSGSSGGMFSNFPSGEGNEFRQVYLTILLILGLIFFAKEAPKFIKEAMGIKDSGGSLFDDVKSIGKAAGLVGGAAVGVTSGVIGGVGSTVESFKNGHPIKGLTGIPGNIIGGVAGGALRGGAAGLSGANKGNPLKGLSSAYSAQAGRNAIKMANAAAGSTSFGRLGARASNFALGSTPADWDQRKLDEYKAVDTAMKAYDDQVTNSALKSSKSYTVSSGKIAGKMINLGSHNRHLTLAKQGDAASMSYLRGLGYSNVEEADADYVINVEKDIKGQYVDAVKAGTETGLNADLVTSARRDADTALKGVTLYDANGNRVTTRFDGKNTGDFRKYSTMSTSRINNSPRHRARVQNASSVRKKNGK